LLDISWIALCECDSVYDTSPGILKDCQLISVGASAAIVDLKPLLERVRLDRSRCLTAYKTITLTVIASFQSFCFIMGMGMGF
jgi:hypothetical protein